MISIENPPPDPSSCPCDQISLLKSSDEKASVSASDNQLALVEEVDLLKSGIDDSKPLPKFSIRDYVSSLRSKDITANWPFSQKILKLCLKHGVTNLLPPFQSLDLLRDPSVSRCAIENSLPNRGTVSCFDGEPSRPVNEFVSATSDSAKISPELALDSVCIDSSGSKGDTEFQSRPEVDTAPENKSPCLEQGADKSVEASEEKSEQPEIPPASQKSESSTQNPVKKCRLVVKLSQIVEPVITREDITPNNFMVSETMASKVCPVCKTFSSSSNTTLNAHIDQCLSGESTMKWSANSKVIKQHRIKPRKTRLMVDIYETAPYCTLEDLDRRNGTSWASSSRFPAQEIEFHGEEKEQRVSTVNIEDTGREGAVYFDTNGTKVRILSVPKLGIGDDHGSRKLMRRGRGSKFLTSKKIKKLHEQKHHKYLKLAPDSKKLCSPKPRRGFETQSGQEENFSIEESHKKEDRQKQHSKAQEHIKLDDSGTIRPWACSRRTVHAKKSSVKDDNRGPRYNATKDLLAESNNPSSSGNPISSSKSSERMATSSYERLVDENRKQPLLRRRVGSCSGSPVGKRRSLVLPKQTFKQLRKEGTSLHDSGEDPPNGTENHVSSPSNKAVEMNADPSKNFDGFVIISKASRFSSLKNNLLSVSQESIPESKFNLKRKFSALKKSRVHCISKENAVLGPYQVDRLHDPLQDPITQQSRMDEEITEKASLGVLKIRKKKGGLKVCGNEESISLKSSQLAPGVDYPVQFGTNLAGSLGDVESARKEIQTHGEPISIEPASRVDVGGSFMSLTKSLNPEFHKLASPDNQFDSQRCIELYQGPLSGAEGLLCSPEPGPDDKDEMFCADDIGKTMIGQNIGIGAESDSKGVGQGYYFTEVDPIPIPGPPGSFLPSPGGDMVSSEDLQGNSKLTTSRVQSSEDHHDLVDGDSLSDSPTSTISNPTLARSDSRSSKKLTSSLAVQDEVRPGFSGATIDAVEENSAQVPPAANIGAERTNVDEWRVNAIFPEKEPLGLKNDQPCCCSRKEGSSQSVASNNQELALLRRRALDSNKRPSSLNFRSEMFSLGNYPSSSAPEMGVLPSLKSPAGHTSLAASADCEVKFPIHSDCDSASPSSSKPILRLMGKNLMVVEKDEDLSPQHRLPWSSALNDHPNRQFGSVSVVSPGNVQNEDYHSVRQAIPLGPIIFCQNQNGSESQHSDVRLRNDFRSHVDLKTPQTPILASETKFTSTKVVAGGFMTSMDCYDVGRTHMGPTPHGRPRQDHNANWHEYKGGMKLPNEQTRPNNRLDTQLACDRNGYSTGNAIKEIIIIDDSPEYEADATHNERMRRNRASSSSIPIYMPPGYNSRHGNPFHNYQSQSSSPYGGSPVVRNASFQKPPCREVNASLAKWSCTPEGSSPSSLAASSPTTGQMRSRVYYPPSFS